MDDILEYLSRFLGPAEWLPDDAVIGRTPSIMGAGGITSLPARIASIRSIAQRSPELIRWLASGKVLKEGGARWNQLTQGLTAAQKGMVSANPQAFRNYFRRMQQAAPNQGVRVGTGRGPGTAVTLRAQAQLPVRTTGTAVVPASGRAVPQAGSGTAVATRTPMAVRGRGITSVTPNPTLAGTNASRNLLPWLIGGGTGALALSQLLGGEEEMSLTPEVMPEPMVRGRGAHMALPEAFQGQRPPPPAPTTVERMRNLMPSEPTALVERTRRADMGVPVQDVVMAELQRKPEMRRQFVKSDIPGVMGTWQDLPYELQPATMLSEREIMRMIEKGR